METGYDTVGRIELRTDQNGDTMTSVYDMASRVLRREYRLKANSPSGPIADQDSFTYDAASRMSTGVNGRYNNSVTHSFDLIGRLQTESLTIGVLNRLGIGLGALGWRMMRPSSFEGTNQTIQHPACSSCQCT